MNLLLTVITINYNNAIGLLKTIKSVIQQTYTDFEYVIIDGGSTDSSLAVIKDFETEVNYWVSEPDNGVYNAMNKGLKAAKGDFVFFLNSGDVLYDDNVIAKLLNTLSLDDDLVYGDVLLKHEHNNWERLQVHPEILPFSYFYKGTICQQACFFKKSLFDSIFYFNETYKIISDWEFLVYALYIKQVKYRKINLLISIYDMEGISSTPELRYISKQEREQVLSTFFPLFIDDYKRLTSYTSPRFAQLQRIEKSVFLRRIVSVFFKFILFFFPKTKS